MKVPPASTKWSRTANEVFSSVTDPKSIAPSARTLTSRRVVGSVPMVRYFMSVPSGHGRRRSVAVRRSVEVEVHFNARRFRPSFRRGHHLR